MAKQYDASLKHLVELRPEDWLDFAGLPHAGNVVPIDADATVVTGLADKVLRVDDSEPYVAHLEFQSGPDSELDSRVLYYNVVLKWRHKLPVRSVVFLISPKAAGPTVRGGVHESAGSDHFLSFRYRLIRAWELPLEQILKAGVATLPLAILAARFSEVPGVVRELQHRSRGLNATTAAELNTAAYLLAGVRPDADAIRGLIKGALPMKDSITYQEILREGEARGAVRGELNGRRDDLLRLGVRRLGPVPEHAATVIAATDAPDRLAAMLDRLFDATSWDDVIAP